MNKHIVCKLHAAFVLAAFILGASTSLSAEDAPAPTWQSVGWGGGGYFWACAFHPAKDGVIYLGGDCNGMYKTEDHGKHWRIINRGLSDYAVYSIAVDAAHPDTVYAGTTTGLCKSVDAGEHWEFLEATGMKAQAIFADRGKSVRAIAVDPQNGELLAGTPRGVIFSSADGKTWKKLHELKDKGVVASVAISPKNSKALLAATSNAGLLMSSDDGETWTEAAGVPKSVKHATFALSDDAIIYAACGKDGVWKSTDHGQTWNAATTGIDPKSHIIEIAVDPKNPDEVFAMASVGWGGSFFHSSDGGKSWTGVNAMKADPEGNPTLPAESHTPTMSSLTNLSVNPNNGKELFLSANWRNAYSADGGQTWEERDRGTDISCVTDIRFLDGKTYVTVMDEGLLASDDNGASWKQLFPLKYIAGQSGHHWRVIPTKNAEGVTRIVSATSAWDAPVNKIQISADGGKTFKATADGLPKERPKKNTMWGDGYARAMAIDPKDPQTLYLGIDGDPDPAHKGAIDGGGVFKSTDGGATWKQLAKQPGSRRMFYGLCVDPTEPKRIFWGSCGDNGGVYRSEDGGESWTLAMKDEPWVFNLGISAAGDVYCCGNNLWHSADHGATWKKISDFKDGNTIVGFEIHPKDEKTIWISRVSWGSGSWGGIFKTTDGGATWQDISGDIPYRKPLVLRFNPETSELWAGNVGLYKMKQ